MTNYKVENYLGGKVIANATLFANTFTLVIETYPDDDRVMSETTVVKFNEIPGKLVGEYLKKRFSTNAVFVCIDGESPMLL